MASAGAVTSLDFGRISNLLPDSKIDFQAFFEDLLNQIVSISLENIPIISKGLFVAWKSFKEERRWVIEKELLQKLLDTEILLPGPVLEKTIPKSGDSSYHSPPPKLSEKLGELWTEFLENKTDPDAETMFYSTFRPAVFRMARSANSMVRANAFKVLDRFFPLRDPATSVIEQAEAIDKQIALLQDALKDDSPLVRSTVIEVICHILTVFWDLIPLDSATQMVTILAKEHAFDGSSINCRTAVLAGILYIVVHCSSSHDLVRSILHFFQKLIYDPSDKVQSAYFELLITVSKILTGPKPKIPEISNLKQIIITGSPAVSHNASVLLQSEIFPLDSTPKDRLALCLNLIETNFMAACKFFAQLPLILSKKLNSLLTLTQLIFDILGVDLKPKKKSDFKTIKLSHLEIVAVIICSFKSNLKIRSRNKFFDSLKKHLTADFFCSLIEHFGIDSHLESSAIFTIASALDISSPSLNVLAQQAFEVENTSDSASGAIIYFLRSKDFEVYLENLILKIIKAPISKPKESKSQKRKSCHPNSNNFDILERFLSIPDALQILIDHSLFEKLLTHLRSFLIYINEYISNMHVPLTRTIDLYFRLCIQAASRAQNVCSDSQPSIDQRPNICADLLELAQNITLEEDSILTQVEINLAILCYNLASDLFIIGFVDGEMILPFLKFFGADSTLSKKTGSSTFFSRLQIIDQASELMRLYLPPGVPLHLQKEFISNAPKSLAEQIHFGFLSAYQLFQSIPYSDQLKEANQMLNCFREIFKRFDVIMCEAGFEKDFLSKVIYLLLKKPALIENTTSSKRSGKISPDKLKTTVLLEALERSSCFPINEIAFTDLLCNILRSFCDPPSILEHMEILITAYSNSAFLSKCKKAWDKYTELEVKIEASQDPNFDPDNTIQISCDNLEGVFCPCNCGRYAPLNGKVLFLEV